MEGKARKAGIAIGAIVAIAAVVYIFVTPYNRTPGVRLGGSLAAAPSDWIAVNSTRRMTLDDLANPTLPWEVFFWTPR